MAVPAGAALVVALLLLSGSLRGGPTHEPMAVPGPAVLLVVDGIDIDDVAVGSFPGARSAGDVGIVAALAPGSAGLEDLAGLRALAGGADDERSGAIGERAAEGGVVFAGPDAERARRAFGPLAIRQQLRDEERRQPYWPDAWEGPSLAAELAGAVDAGADVVVSTLSTRANAPGGAYRPRGAVMRALDLLVADLRRSLPTDATVVVAGLTSPEGYRGLTPLLVWGPSGAARAWGPSTGRLDLVTPADVSRTVAAAGRSAPAEGVHVAPGTPSPAEVAELQRRSAVHATSYDRTVRQLRTGSVLAFAAALLAIRFGGRRSRAAAGWAVATVVVWPAVTFAIGPGVLDLSIGARLTWAWALAAVTAAIAVGVARGEARRAVEVVALVTVVVVAGDLVLGGVLHRTGPLGTSDAVAARFRGLGNVGFGVLAGAVLVVAVAAARTAADRRVGAARAAGVLLVAVVVVGAPSMGADLGGVMALVPASVVVTALVAGIRPSWRLVLAAGGLLVLTLVLLVGVDLARPAASRTHLGRFAAGVADGSIDPFDVIGEKNQANVATTRRTRWTGVAVAPVVSVAVLAWWRRARGERLPAPDRALTAGLLALGAIGFAVNDSGALVAAPVLLWLGAATVVATADAGDPDPAADPARPHTPEGADRVRRPAPVGPT